MNGNIVFIILFNIVLIISSIYLKKYIRWIYPLVFILLLNVLITLKYNIEGFDIYSEQPDMNNLLKLNTSLDKLIALFRRNRQDCEGRFESLGCSKMCGFGKEEKYYQIYRQRGEKGYPCPHVEGKIIIDDCIDRYCKIGESCTENTDCQNNNCVNGLCATEYECGEGEYLQYCEEDGCKALDEKHRSSGDRYIWDGYSKCNYQRSINNDPLKSDISTPESTPGSTTTTHSGSCTIDGSVYMAGQNYPFLKYLNASGCKNITNEPECISSWMTFILGGGGGAEGGRRCIWNPDNNKCNPAGTGGDNAWRVKTCPRTKFPTSTASGSSCEPNDSPGLDLADLLDNDDDYVTKMQNCQNHITENECTNEEVRQAGSPKIPICKWNNTTEEGFQNFKEVEETIE